MDRDRDKDKKAGSPSGGSFPQEIDAGVPSVGPHNRALGEIYQKLYPEMRRPKPNQKAIAAALQAMQQLTMEADSEAVAEEASTDAAGDAQVACSVCGHLNREGNKFCGACGLPVDTAPGEAPTLELPEPSLPKVREKSQQIPSEPILLEEPGSEDEVHPQPGAPAGNHHYHHHYHHHYFQGSASNGGTAAPRATAPESAREADRMRVAAAAKGEPMTRSEAAVRRLTQEWVLACNTRQLDELIDLYSSDALVLRSNLPPIRGAAAVREFFFSALEAGLGEVALDPLRVEVLGDLAHEVGRYSALVPGTVGKRREERGKYLWVFAKQASGDWKLVSECWSCDLTLTGAESDVPKAVAASGKTRRS